MAKRIESNRSASADHRRALLAQEAARLIRDHGIKDFRTAKSKAAAVMGLRDKGALPSNREIEAALAERNRIFGAVLHSDLLHNLRGIAIEVMHELQTFRPCLVGSVLSGNVTEHSNINLHVFSDASESVGLKLDAIGIVYHLRQRRQKLRRDAFEDFPVYQFWVEHRSIDATVFPERRQSHAPLSPVDGRPMRRARVHHVEQLVETGMEA